MSSTVRQVMENAQHPRTVPTSLAEKSLIDTMFVLANQNQYHQVLSLFNVSSLSMNYERLFATVSVRPEKKATQLYQVLVTTVLPDWNDEKISSCRSIVIIAGSYFPENALTQISTSLWNSNRLHKFEKSKFKMIMFSVNESLSSAEDEVITGLGIQKKNRCLINVNTEIKEAQKMIAKILRQ